MIVQYNHPKSSMVRFESTALSVLQM